MKEKIDTQAVENETVKTCGSYLANNSYIECGGKLGWHNHKRSRICGYYTDSVAYLLCYRRLLG